MFGAARLSKMPAPLLFLKLLRIPLRLTFQMFYLRIDIFGLWRFICMFLMFLLKSSYG